MHEQLILEALARPEIEARFSALFSEGDGCWTWNGRTDTRGYGRVCLGDKPLSTLLAHRVAFVRAFGVFDGERLVCHKCDNPPCVRPDHLFLGDDAANNADMIRKGRAFHPFGETHCCAKLTAEKVVEIRARAALGEGARPLARVFGVSDMQIRDIVARRSWKHVP